MKKQPCFFLIIKIRKKAAARAGVFERGVILTLRESAVGPRVKKFRSGYERTSQPNLPGGEHPEFYWTRGCDEVVLEMTDYLPIFSPLLTPLETYL